MSKEIISPLKASVNVTQIFDPRFISCGKCRFCIDDKNRFSEKFCVLTLMTVPVPTEVAFFCPMDFSDRVFGEDNNGTDP